MENPEPGHSRYNYVFEEDMSEVPKDKFTHLTYAILANRSQGEQWEGGKTSLITELIKPSGFILILMTVYTGYRKSTKFSCSYPWFIYI